MRMQRKIFFSFLFVIALPTLAFCFILLRFCGRLIEDRTLNASVVVIQESIKRIDNRLDDYHSMTMQVYFNSELMESLAASARDESEREQAALFSREILKSFVNSDKHLVTAVLRTADMDISAGTDIIGMDALIKAYAGETSARPGRLVWIPTTPLSTVFGLDSRYFGAIRQLRLDGEVIGTLLLLVREDFFHDSEAGELPLKGSSDFIITSDGQLISGPDPGLIGTRSDDPCIDRVLNDNTGCFVSDDGSSYIVYRQSDLTGWIFVRMLKRDAVLRHFSSLKESLFILIGLFILFLVILSYFFSNGLAKPLAELIRQIDFFGEGNLTFTPAGSGNSNNEIDCLNRSIEAMTGRIHTLIGKVAEEEQLKTTAELKALRSQLNPHFIYNTLNTIRWMAAVNRQSNIEETVMALTALMRSASDMDRTIIPLEEELNILRQYVLIQEKRYHQFRLETDVAEEVHQAGINKFLIQPFVENSLIHGFREKNEEGIINLKVEKTTGPAGTGLLTVTIRDNGCGFDPDALPAEREPGREAAVHTGIRNIRRRLQLNYGSEQELILDSAPGRGCLVTLSIPFMETGV